MEKLVTIATFDFPAEAQTMKLLLEEQGINATIVDDNIVRMNWFLANAVGGAKLQVLESDAQRASQFVESNRQISQKGPDDTDQPSITFDCEECGRSLTFPGRRRGGVENCPHCHRYIDVPD